MYCIRSGLLVECHQYCSIVSESTTPSRVIHALTQSFLIVVLLPGILSACLLQASNMPPQTVKRYGPLWPCSLRGRSCARILDIPPRNSLDGQDLGRLHGYLSRCRSRSIQSSQADRAGWPQVGRDGPLADGGGHPPPRLNERGASSWRDFVGHY